MTKSDLKEYIYQAVVLEQKCYEVNKLLNKIFIRKKEYEEQYIQSEIKFEDKKVKAYHDIGFFNFLGVMLGVGFLLFLGIEAIGLILWFLGLFIEPIEKFLAIKINENDKNLIISLFIACTILLSFKASDEGRSRKQAKKENKKIKEEVRNKNINIRQQNEIVKYNKENILPVYNKEYEILSKQYYLLKSNLDKLYSFGIVYPKYRSLIPICSFYEYLSSGRCNSLEGHEGAYNIYEMELRQNIIIGKLDIVIDKLDEIACNQYMLYEKLDESNKQVTQMYNNLSNQLRSIENNSYITAYNSQITAKNTEFLKWFTVFKERNLRNNM